jgi:hypothetical protein
MTNFNTDDTDATSKRAPGRARLADTPRTGARTAASKSATVMKLLSRARGVTILELAHATSWQPHSVRAYFSGLRKKGLVLMREIRKNGEGAYRIKSAPVPASDAAALAEPSRDGMSGAVGAPTANAAVA